jgi:hypothetical protein
MRTFANVQEFAAHYEKLTKEQGGRNLWRAGLAKSGCYLPPRDNEEKVLFFEDYYVRVVLSTESASMVIERKQNDNPVYCRIRGEVIRTHGEWSLCQHPELVTR